MLVQASRSVARCAASHATVLVRAMSGPPGGKPAEEFKPDMPVNRALTVKDEVKVMELASKVRKPLMSARLRARYGVGMSSPRTARKRAR
jgi:hypothetical protein